MAASFLAVSYAASHLPSILVPLTGLALPALAFAFLFLYIEREDPSGI